MRRIWLVVVDAVEAEVGADSEVAVAAEGVLVEKVDEVEEEDAVEDEAEEEAAAVVVVEVDPEVAVASHSYDTKRALNIKHLTMVTDIGSLDERAK